MPRSAAQEEAQCLLDRLKDDRGRIPPREAEEALGRLKVLGRDAGNVGAIYDAAGLSTLGDYGLGTSSPTAGQEALRCLANALLLLPPTRRLALQLAFDRKAADSLNGATVDGQFLLARILLLLTYDPDINLPRLVDDHGLAETMVKHLSNYAATVTNGTGLDASSTMAMVEMLRLFFNVTSETAVSRDRFLAATPSLVQLVSRLDMPTPALDPPMGPIINALANLDVREEDVAEDTVQNAVDKLITILGRAITQYASSELDALAIPLLTVLRKINETTSPEMRRHMKTQLLPNDAERDQPLGKSSSLASRLLQLTTAGGLVHLHGAIAGMMFELSDQDAGQYVKNVGYGYAAGYLMSRQIPVPASATATTGPVSADQPLVNPITGQRLDKEDEIAVPEMTAAEKEREAERLFVLFERLKATGVVNVQNPVEAARDEGRFEELSDSDPD